MSYKQVFRHNKSGRK